MNTAYGIGAIIALLGAVIALPGFRKWVRKIRRRRGGVYVWRVDHHINRARRVFGYAGETNSFYFRARQHMGVSRYHPETGQVVRGRGPGVPMIKVPAQPWSDLRPKMYKVVKLPWWLCWKWVLRPLETLVILCTWPVYNDAKNRWNPRRITTSQAKLDRARRDAGSARYVVRTWTAHLVRGVLQTVGVVLFLGVVALGAYGWVVTT
jgi:hypothetical protein